MIIGRIKKDNSGMSLLELIAVISIMTIIVGVSSLSIGLIFSRDAERSAVIIDDELTEARMLSMSKSGIITMCINTNTDPTLNTIDIKQGGTIYKTVRIDKSVLISMAGSATSSPGSVIIIEFDKSNGSVKSINGSPAVDNGLYEIQSQSQRGSSRTATVTLVANTGKHYIQK